VWRNHTEEGLQFSPNIGYFTKHRTAWNKGLTRETDVRVDKLVKTRIERYKNGELTGWNKGLRKNKPLMVGLYPAYYFPEHNRALDNGYVYEHYLVAEKILNRPLKPKEVVHHKDKNKRNNNENNIMIFRTTGDHSRFHHIGSGKYKLILCNDGVYECKIA
jgi:hypothetical protein